MFFFFVDQPAGAFLKMSFVFVFLHEGHHCSENYTGKAGKLKKMCQCHSQVHHWGH